MSSESLRRVVPHQMVLDEPLDRALGDQIEQLAVAIAMVESARDSLTHRFESEWQKIDSDMPDYDRVLRAAASMINETIRNLEMSTLRRLAAERGKTEGAA